MIASHLHKPKIHNEANDSRKPIISQTLLTHFRNCDLPYDSIAILVIQHSYGDGDRVTFYPSPSLHRREMFVCAQKCLYSSSSLPSFQRSDRFFVSRHKRVKRWRCGLRQTACTLDAHLFFWAVFTLCPLPPLLLFCSETFEHHR